MVGTVDYFIKCMSAGHGHWTWQVPEDTLAVAWFSLVLMIAMPILQPLYFATVNLVRRIPGANQGDDE